MFFIAFVRQGSSILLFSSMIGLKYFFGKKNSHFSILGLSLNSYFLENFLYMSCMFSGFTFY